VAARAARAPSAPTAASGTPEALITLDHVTPRRGRDAYDRRDNLVLACQRCNGLKADKPILAFLLARPSAPTGCCATAST
jgi:5-methylcytosine-specific restriction endonuclease McrA